MEIGVPIFVWNIKQWTNTCRNIVKLFLLLLLLLNNINWRWWPSLYIDRAINKTIHAYYITNNWIVQAANSSFVIKEFECKQTPVCHTITCLCLFSQKLFNNLIIQSSNSKIYNLHLLLFVCLFVSCKTFSTYYHILKNWFINYYSCCIVVVEYRFFLHAFLVDCFNFQM